MKVILIKRKTLLWSVKKNFVEAFEMKRRISFAPDVTWPRSFRRRANKNKKQLQKKISQPQSWRWWWCLLLKVKCVAVVLCVFHLTRKEFVSFGSKRMKEYRWDLTCTVAGLVQSSLTNLKSSLSFFSLAVQSSLLTAKLSSTALWLSWYSSPMFHSRLPSDDMSVGWTVDKPVSTKFK